MISKYVVLRVVCVLVCSGVVSARPGQAYVQQLVGQVDQNWLTSAGKSIAAKPLQWTTRKAPGFNDPSALGRSQAFLSQRWNFYSVDAMRAISKATEVQLPHRFERRRSYHCGWYVTAFQMDKKPDKRYVLLLDRIATYSVFYVNGVRCGDHFGSFTPFEIDITDAMIQGDNAVAIFVYDQSASYDTEGGTLSGKDIKVYNQLGVARLGQMASSGGIGFVPKIEVREKAFIKDIFIKTSTRKREMDIEYEFSPKTTLSPESTLSFELFRWPDATKVALDMPVIALNSSASETIHRIDKTLNTCTVKWPDADLWSPDHPNLYVLRATLRDGQQVDVLDTRFGFREFWIEGKSFFLNGIPVRLRGDSIYEQKIYGINRHLEEFRRQKKRFGINACRIHHAIPPVDLLYAADEVGVLIDDQSSIWSSMAPCYKNGGEFFLYNTRNEFEEWVRRDRNCPSVVIWDLENEMLRVSYEAHLPWVEKLPEFVLTLDDTRPLNHSGGGFFSPYQHMAWLHMQEQYCKIISDWQVKGTYPLVIGEFWVGGRADFNRIPHSPELITPDQQTYERAVSYAEKILEMRYLGVSGIMPFKLCTTIPARSSKASQQRIRHALQPATVFFWPRQQYVASDASFQRELVVCNDGETTERFELSWSWDNQEADSQTMTLPPAGQQRFVLEQTPPVGAKHLTATLRRGKEIVASETLLVQPIRVPNCEVAKPIQVYKDSVLVDTLVQAGISAVVTDRVPDVKDDVLWVIGEHADNRQLNVLKDKILAYLNEGGRILCLKQDQTPRWFPVKFPFWSANQAGIHTYALMGWKGLNKNLFYAREAPLYAVSHPVFAGLSMMPLHVWDSFDGRISDDVFSRPSNINRYEQGNWRPLAGGTRMEHISLAEIFYGKGLMLACQLHVIDNLDNAQAKLLFVNMLNYLSGQQPQNRQTKIAVRGALQPEQIIALTGVDEAVFVGASAQNHDLMMAAEGTPLSDIKDWVCRGGRVWVVSGKVSQAYDGVELSRTSMKRVAKTADHPFLYGVSSANFTKANMADVKGYFGQIPAGAKELLRGFSSTNRFGPVVISVPYEKGQLLLSTLELQDKASAGMRELLCLILTNYGVEVPYSQKQKETVAIKKTVPLTMDGQLTEWLEDMEDRYVTQYIHAQPIYLTSENIIAGPPEFDLNLSAIDYCLWDDTALYIAGVVFSEERTWESGVTWGSQKEYKMDILFNDDAIAIDYKNNQINVTVNQQTDDAVLIKAGQMDSKDLTDAASLQFIYIHKSGQIRGVSSLVGETFELKIPWQRLKAKPTDKAFKALITVEAKGSKLQTPLLADPKSRQTWLDMNLTGKR